MAILPNGQPTLADAAAQFGDNGVALKIAEMLHKLNPALNDVPFEEANSTTGNKVGARQKLPETYLRRINKGIKPSKSGYGSVLESAGLFAALGQVDAKLLEISPDKQRFLMNENRGHFESIGQRYFQSLFYGDPAATPEDFLGIAPRLDSLNTAEFTSAQIIDAEGNDTDLTSIYLVGWGEGSVMGHYPKGSQAGIQHKDMGVNLAEDGDGGKYPAQQDWFELDAGLSVYDYRNIVRIANIDVSALTTDASAGAKLIELMVMAQESLNSPDGLNPVFYVPRVIGTYLRLQITNKNNVWMGMKEVAGQRVTAFDGTTVRRADAISLNESRVTA